MIKVGLFGIGLDTYWPQFEGLLNRLEGYQKQVADKMEGFGAEVVGEKALRITLLAKLD